MAILSRACCTQSLIFWPHLLPADDDCQHQMSFRFERQHAGVAICLLRLQLEPWLHLLLADDSFSLPPAAFTQSLHLRLSFVQPLGSCRAAAAKLQHLLWQFLSLLLIVLQATTTAIADELLMSHYPFPTDHDIW